MDRITVFDNCGTSEVKHTNLKLYHVVHESYYDDFGAGGEATLDSWIFLSKSNAISKVAELKPVIYAKLKEEISRGELIDTPEEYAIRDKDSMREWGQSVYIKEIITED